MKIIEFRAENVKKLSLLELKLDQNKALVVVAGPNGQGKSTVLDAIEMAIHGERHIGPKPVRRGQEKGSVELDLGDYRVKRTMTADGGGSLVLYNKDGQKQASPQTILDDLYTRTTFDPLALLTMKPADQADTLRRLLGLDFTKIDAEREKVFAERTSVNRDIKAKEAMISSNPRYKEAPVEEQSAAAVMEEQERAAEVNASNAKMRNATETLHERAMVTANEVVACVKAVDEITLEIQRMQKKLTVAEVTLKEAEQKNATTQEALTEAVAKTKGIVDVELAPFAQKIRDIEALNAKVRKNKEVDQMVRDLTEYRRKGERLTDRLDAIDREKRDIMAAAKFPVPGLGFDEANRLTFDGLPFENANIAEQIKVSVAMGMALNPKLRVLLIKRGNDLDDNNMRLLAQIAQERDYQVWIERVSTEGDVSVILEDGHAKTPQDAPAATQPSPEASKPQGGAKAEAGTPVELKLQ